MRLVKSETSLLPSQGFELHPRTDSNASQGFSKDTAYAIPFDLKIPGWLPQSFENDTVALSYGLIATAKIEWVSLKNTPDSTSHAMDVDTGIPMSSSPVSIMSTSSPTYASRFFPRFAKSVASALATAITMPSYYSSQQVKRSSDWQPITISRHRVPAPASGVASSVTADSIAETPLRHYTLRPAENSPSPVECVVSVPETIDINGPTLRVSVRLRARDGYSIAGIEGEEPSQSPSSSATQENGHETSNHNERELDGALTGAEPAHTNAPSGSIPGPQRKTLKHIRMVELGMEVEETERYS